MLTNVDRRRGKLRQHETTAKFVAKLILEAGFPPEGSQTRLIAERLLEMPKTHMRGYVTAMRGRSRRAAMKAFCLMCTGWEKEEVRRCMDLACPLYPYRPYQ